MAKSRREFLAKGSMGLVGAAMATTVASGGQTPATPGAPPTFGTAAAVGPKVDAETFAVAEKLVQVEMSAKDRAEAAGNWQQSMAAVVERRVGPRKIAIGYGEVPATVWLPMMPVKKFSPPRRVPYGVTLVGQLFGEGPMVEAGIRLEEAFGVAAERPKGF